MSEASAVMLQDAFATLGSALSVRGFIRFGSSLSVKQDCGRFSGKVSILDRTNLGSSMSIRRCVITRRFSCVRRGDWGGALPGVGEGGTRGGVDGDGRLPKEQLLHKRAVL